MTELVRKNIRMSETISTWYEDKAKELGISQTNLMVIALNDYIRNDTAIQAMSNINPIIAQLELLSYRIEEVKKGK